MELHVGIPQYDVVLYPLLALTHVLPLCEAFPGRSPTPAVPTYASVSTTGVRND